MQGPKVWPIVSNRWFFSLLYAYKYLTETEYENTHGPNS